MPLPATGSEAPESAVEASRNQKERDSENAAQKYELGKRVVGKQPFGTQIERKAGKNAEQKECDSGAVMVVRCRMRYQKICSAGIQKTQSLVQLRFIVTGL